MFKDEIREIQQKVPGIRFCSFNRCFHKFEILWPISIDAIMICREPSFINKMKNFMRR